VKGCWSAAALLDSNDTVGTGAVNGKSSPLWYSRPGMEPLTLELMSKIAALAGYAWTEEELRAIAPQVERSLEALRKLDSLPLQDTDLSTVFHAGPA
jgi:hypothetical protein